MPKSRKKPSGPAAFLLALAAWVLIAPHPAWGGPGLTVEQFIASAAAQSFKRGDYEGALQGFEALLTEHPEDVQVLRYLAIVHTRLGHYPEALATFDKALALAPRNAALHFYLGVAHFKQGEGALARRSFEKSIALQYDSLYAEKAKQYLQVMTRQAAEYRPPGSPGTWQLYLQLGSQFDSNVLSVARETKGDEDVFRLTEYLSLGYRPVQDRAWSLLAELATYQTQHLASKTYLDPGTTMKLDANDEDLSLYQGKLDFSYLLQAGTKPLLPSLSYVYELVQLQGERFSDSHTLTAGLDAGLSENTTTRLFYRLGFDNFKETGETAALTDRDATRHTLGLIEYLFFAQRRAYAALGYEYQVNRAQGRNWDFFAHKGLAELSFPVFFDIQTDLSVEYERRNFNNFVSDSAVSERRSTWDYSAALSRTLWKHLAATLSYSYREQEARVANFDLRQHVATFALAVSY